MLSGNVKVDLGLWSLKGYRVDIRWEQGRVSISFWNTRKIKTFCADMIRESTIDRRRHHI